MEYVAAIFVITCLVYILSFAKYSLGKKNKEAFAGAILLAFLTIALPILVMIRR